MANLIDTQNTASETTGLAAQLADLHNRTRALAADPKTLQEHSINGSAYVLSDKNILCMERSQGDSRYPYGFKGFNFWVYASGYMHANEGLLSTFLKAAHGEEPNIAFFAGKPRPGKDSEIMPLFAVPKMLGAPEGVQRYTVFNPSAAYFITEYGSLRMGIRVFVMPTKEISFSIHVENTGPADEVFFLSSFLNPFLRHQITKSDEDNWFKEVSVLPSASASGALEPFLLQVHEDKDRHTLTTNYGVLRRQLSVENTQWLTASEATTSRLDYVGGSGSSLHTPQSLLQGTFGEHPRHLCTFTETGVMADLLHMRLPAGKSARLDMLFAVPDSHEAALALSKTTVDPLAIDSELARLQTETAVKHEALKVHFGASNGDDNKSVAFNAFMEHLKMQVEFCSLIKGYIQLSFNSLIGIRDVFQAIEGMLFWCDEAAKEKMLEALGFTAIDGRCFRQYSLPPANQDVGRMDLRQFIDQGVWVISTIHTYLRVTQDWDFLNAPCGYHEIVDEPTGKVIQSDQVDSVLDHLIKIMGYLLRNRDHEHTKCSLALYGDWNDALDGLGISSDGSSEFGTGVSVMATLQVYQNTHEMVDLLQRVDGKRYAAEIEQYQHAANEIEQGLLKHAVVSNAQGEQRILHGWGDKYSYLVGSHKDVDGKSRYGLTSIAFWVLSGIYRKHPEFKQVILDGLEQLDSKYGFRSFAPAFELDAKGVGRIPKLPAGTAENGASYIHATAFGIMALFQMGEAEKAWEQLDKILPFTPGHEHLTHSPYIMPNSYGHNPEKGIDGQNMNDWQTGSSNVVLKTLIRFVFGFEPELDSICIQPAAWCPFKDFEFTLKVRNCDITIRYRNANKGERIFKVNGEIRAGEPDQFMGIHKLRIANEQLKAASLVIEVED